MSRWDTYLTRLDEKVSKKEIDTALKNDNILIGCEFEFKVTDGFEYADSEAAELYSRAFDEWEEYEKDLETYQEERDEYIEETQEIEKKIETTQARIDQLESALESLSEHDDELESEIYDLESDIEDIRGEISDGDDLSQDEIDDLYDKITNLEPDVEERKKKLEYNQNQREGWEKEISDMERSISDMEDDVKYREEEGMYEDLSEPYASEGTMPNYFEYMTNWMGYSVRDIEAEIGESIDRPIEWEGEMGFDDFEAAVEGSILQTAPFDDYEVGDYGGVDQRPGSTSWAIEPDSSLGDEGVEVKNPPMELPDFVPDLLDDTFEWIDDIGYTDSDCGFHCHMSLKKPGKDGLDFLKLVLFTDEGYIYSVFEDRVGNSYTKSIKDKLKSQGYLGVKDTKKVFNQKKLIMKVQMNHEHFDSINVIDSDSGHVEFRYMGGSSYHRKGKEIKAIIGMYAHNLSLAMDPDYKRKEYTLKLQRIFNKMELFYLERLLDTIRIIKRKIEKDGGYLEKEDIKVFDRIFKREEVKYKRLASTYKLDTRTKTALKANSVFMEGVKSDMLETLRVGLHSSGGAFSIMRDVVYRK